MKSLIINGIFASVLLLNACSSKEKSAQSASNQATPEIEVSAYTVAEEAIKAEKSYPARVVAINETELRAEVNGYITKIYAKDGSNVQKGQALYEIDRQRYNDSYQLAISNLNISKANLEKTNRDLTRYENLKKQDAIAQQILDNAYTDVNNAKSQISAAQAQVSSAALDLNRATVRAPFSGTIGISSLRMGALVTAASSLLNTISASNPMAVEFALDEQSIPMLSKLKNTKIDSLFTLTLPDGSKYPYTGTLTVIDRAVNPQTGTIPVRINFNNPNAVLKTGMSTNLFIKTNDHGKKLAIPYKAVTEQLSDYFVYVITDSNTISQRLVKLGSQYQGKVVINDGLKNGEKIVLEGLQNPLLREGVKVKIGK